MQNKGIQSLFIIPVLLVCYALWSGWRAANSFTDEATAGAAARYLLSVLALGLAGGAVILAGVAVLMCATSVRASYPSQETLIQRFSICRRLLPVFMVAQIAFCGIATISLILSENLWLMSVVGSEAVSKSVWVSLFCISVIGWMLIKSLASIRKCFALFAPEDMTISGIAVSEAQAPALWRWVRALASAGQLSVPDNIVTGLLEGFYVTANPVQVNGGERLTGNTLYLPLTFMALLDEDEIAATIGHELGHFTGDDTQYSLRFLPLYVGMQNSLAGMGNSSQGFSWIDFLVLSPALNMGMWFLNHFHEAVTHWSRIREFAADATGARVSSPVALASALLRMTTLEPLLIRQLETIFHGREVCENAIASLVRAVRVSEPFERPGSIDNEISHPTDSHPTTRQRIASLNVPLNEALWSRALRPVTQEDKCFFDSLFASADAICASVTQRVTADILPQVENYRQELETEAEQGRELLTFWTSAKYVWFCLPLCILMLAGGGYLLLYQEVSGWFWLLPAAGILAGFAGVATLQRSRRPMFTLSEDYFSSVWAPQPLPLKHVVDFSLISMNSTMTLRLAVDDAFQPEMTTRWFMQPVRFNPRRHEVVMIILGELYQEREGKRVKLDVEQVADIVGQYLVSAHARAELRHF